MEEEFLVTKEFTTKPIEILLIEDNPGDARIVKEFLKESDVGEFNVTHVKLLSDGKKEIANKEFDVAILDLSLPDSHGFNTFRELRTKAPTIPIIVLTGSVLEREELRQCLSSSQKYLVKNYVNSVTLVTTIFEAIELLITGSKPRSFTVLT